MHTIKSAFVLAAIVGLMGCANLKPTASVEMAYAFPFSSDYWVHQDRSWTCEPPQVRFEVGAETKNQWQGGFYHESFLLCGTLNAKPEIFENGIYLRKAFGGLLCLILLHYKTLCLVSS